MTGKGAHDRAASVRKPLDVDSHCFLEDGEHLLVHIKHQVYGTSICDGPGLGFQVYCFCELLGRQLLLAGIGQYLLHQELRGGTRVNIKDRNFRPQSATLFDVEPNFGKLIIPNDPLQLASRWGADDRSATLYRTPRAYVLPV